MVTDDLDKLADEIFRLVPPIKPEPVCWLNSDAGTSYCYDCARIARMAEMGLKSLPKPAEWPGYTTPESRDFEDGIDGGYYGQMPNDTTEACYTCGVTLAYTLTDYGWDEELQYWTESKVLPVGAGWGPESSYAFDRLCIGVWSGTPAERLAELIAIAMAALSTTH